jgi:hypothetical protein
VLTRVVSLAEGYAVRKLVSKMFMVSCWQDVMSLNLVVAGTVGQLAFVTISYLYQQAPFAHAME